MANPTERMDVYNVTITGSAIKVGAVVATNQRIGSNTSSPILYGKESIYTPDTTDSNIYIGTANATGGAAGFIIQDTNTGTYFLCVPTRFTPVINLTLLVSTGANDPQLANWDVSTNSAVAYCFLAGTRLLTPAGEVAVEQLQVGDLITTLVSGKQVAKAVTWIGHRSVKPGDLRADDAHPIRIRAGAITDMVPHRDLLVTAEHCIFIDGGLVPARMLVNGRSIVVDNAISSFAFYHVELAEHAILFAEGLTAESYLDAGNRGNFANAAVPLLRPWLDSADAHKAWEKAAAPLITSIEMVRPIWQRLHDRAAALGFPVVKAKPVLTDDPALRVIAGDGTVIEPVQKSGGRYMFILGAGMDELRLVSRTFRPSDAIGPFVDDRRQLGVLIGEINLHDGRKKIAVSRHLAPAQLPGWYDIEGVTGRWTTGDAELPVAMGAKPVVLEIQILSAASYRLEAVIETREAQAA